MSRYLIVTSYLAQADAVGNDVLGMHRALVDQGHTVELFAGCSEVREPRVRPVEELFPLVLEPSATLIYHYGIGWHAGLELLQKAQCRCVLKYHNVTPPDFFVGLSVEYAVACRQGTEQLGLIARMPIDLFLSDSEFNQQELIAHGADACRCLVVPPFHVTDRLELASADLDLLDLYQDDKVNFLTVGRLAPNKGHPRLLDAFALYHHQYNPASRLLLVGKMDPRLEAYTHNLQRRVEHLELHDSVHFSNGVSAAELKSYYLVADLLLVTSEHEGFCVPLVEAMAMKVPVVALGRAVVPETLGDAGLVWDEADPMLLAQSLASLIEDETLRFSLSARGRERYCHRFTEEKITERLHNALGSLS